MTARFYHDSTPMSSGATVELSREESHHLLKTLRGRPGDAVIVFGAGQQYAGTLAETRGATAVIQLGESIPAPASPRIPVTFAIPWIKGGKTDYLVQKLTELGAAAIIVFQAQREVARGDDSKLDRLTRIALEACKQCERVDLPRLSAAPSLAAALDLAGDLPTYARLILHERAGSTLLSDAVRALPAATNSLVVASGPEGGWHERDLEPVGESATWVILGPRILRAETAPVAAAAAILALTGDL